MNKIEEFKNEKYDLYYINDNKSKTIEITIMFKNIVTKKELALKSLLLEMLLYASKKYNEPRLLNLKQEELYGLQISKNVKRTGNLSIGEISISILNEKYTDSNNTKNSLDFLKELLFNPLIENNQFNNEYFNIIKSLLINDSLYTLDNPNNKSKYNLLDNLGNSKLEIHNNLDIEILNNITNSELYEYYKSFFKNNNTDIIVSGYINKEFIIDYFNKLNINHNNSYDIKYDTNYNKIYKNKDKSNNSQSNLIMAYTFDNLTEFEYKYVLNIYKHIIGGNSNSLLMQTIREKESLCYGIYSDLYKFDNLLLIESGIKNNTSDKVIDNINKIITNKDLFNEKIVKNNINDFITNLNAISSYQIGLVSLTKQLIDINENFEERISNFNKIKLEDILKIIDKIRFIGYYVLEGEL